MPRILFFSVSNTGRSQMATAFASQIAPQQTEIVAASDSLELIHPIASRVMQEIGVDLAQVGSSLPSETLAQQFDVIITIGNRALDICPTFPGHPARIHWPLLDPVRRASESHEDVDSRFREVRDGIRSRVVGLFEHGFLNSILQVRNSLGSLLENMAEGVMAHDFARKIFYFNQAAQRITGYSSAEVIGRDCHDIFPNLFCGGVCSFCDGKSTSNTQLHYPRAFINKQNQRLDLELSIVSIDTPDRGIIGTMVTFRDVSEVVNLRRNIEHSRGFYGIIGHHPTMLKVFESIRELADVKVPILIQGESGTGKELVANALHKASKRADGPFVPVNCGALPEGILESELFGHVRGAFTGAIHDRKGRFELAEGGTIFLDEIGEISAALQVKLLRVLQDMTFMPVGGERSVHVNVRLICATNKDLKAQTRRGLFRDDLFYRLAVVPIYLPLLKDKRGDVPLLIEHFLEKFAGQAAWSVKQVSPNAMDLLMRYPWPGNVRELGNAIQFGMIKCHGNTIEVKHLPQELIRYNSTDVPHHSGRPSKLDRENVTQVLEQAGGNKAKAARLLGISRMTLYRYIEDDM